MNGCRDDAEMAPSSHKHGLKVGLLAMRSVINCKMCKNRHSKSVHLEALSKMNIQKINIEVSE
jgi:hypothetical protein